MKVFIEADSIATKRTSGIGHATLELTRAIREQLKNTKHKLILIIPFGTKKFLEKHNLEGIKVRTLPPGYKYVNYALTRTSLPIPVDLWFGRGVYIFPNYKTWYTPLSKSITFIHDIAYKIHPDTIHPKNLLYLQANMNRWVRRADNIIAISEASRKEIERLLPDTRNKLSTIHLGVDPGVFFRRPDDEIKEVRDRYGIESNYFIYVGNIEPRKNILRLLDAYRVYSDSVKNPAQLVLVGGDGWNNESIQDSITLLQKENYGIYRPSEYVEDGDLPALYSGARALIQVSLHEGYGLPPVQAQACGTPVVASDLPVFRETLKSDDVFFIDPKTVESITLALTRIDRKYPSNGTAHRNAHTWARTAKKLLVLAGILKREEND